MKEPIMATAVHIPLPLHFLVSVVLLRHLIPDHNFKPATNLPTLNPSSPDNHDQPPIGPFQSLRQNRKTHEQIRPGLFNQWVQSKVRSSPPLNPLLLGVRFIR
jgi:hypothetical protein